MIRRKRDADVTQKIDLAMVKLKSEATRNRKARENLAQVKEDSGKQIDISSLIQLNEPDYA